MTLSPFPHTVHCVTSSSLSFRILREAALVAKDTVVCGFQKENMEWCLCVWRAWGCSELEVFYQSYEKLGHLETNMRKRK